MLRDLLRRNKKPDIGINENDEIDAADNLRTVKKKIDGKKLLLLLSLFAVCAILGFTVITSMVNRGGKILQTSSRKVLTLPPDPQVANATVTQGQQNGNGVTQTMPPAIAVVPGRGEVKLVPVPGLSRVSEKRSSLPDLQQKGQNITKATRTEGRDIFKEFYVKGIEPAGGASGMKRMLEKNMSAMGKIDEHQLQAFTQTAATSPVEQFKEIRIFGITCIGDADCIAITSEGALKKGDMVGSEIVNNVSNTFFTTNRRVVNW